MAEPRQIRFTTGHRRRFWEKNCIAIGLAAGFLEPLESTSIFLIQMGIRRFVSLFPDAGLPDVIRDEYNLLMTETFEHVRDFIILHYKATERNDTPFWDYCRTMDIPESLQRKIALFRRGGRVFRYEEELFTRPSWVAVFLGQHIMPQQCDPIVAVLPAEKVLESVESMRVAMNKAVAAMPTQEEFIARYCATATP
jgi:tryptophan halogenase